MSDAIYVAAEAPAAFTLEVAGSASGPWTTAFRTETATNDGCGADRPHKNEGVWSNAELQAAMASCDGQATTSPGCQGLLAIFQIEEEKTTVVWGGDVCCDTNALKVVLAHIGLGSGSGRRVGSASASGSGSGCSTGCG